MSQQIHLDADLAFSVELPGDHTVTGRLTGSGTALSLTLSDPFAFAGRNDSLVIRPLARALAERGVSVTLVTPAGPLVTLGASRAPWWQRRVTGSRHIRVERVAGLWSLARGRARAGTGALAGFDLRPPGTLWPLVPTLMRRPRRVTTTHDPGRGGNPRLVVAPGEHPSSAALRQVFALRGAVTTIGSDPACDIRLVGTEPWHAEVRHDDRDEFVLVRRGRPGSVRVNGRTTDIALLRTATRVELGEVTLSFARDEHADHGRPYGGRVGGELGHQRPQPARPGTTRRYEGERP